MRMLASQPECSARLYSNVSNHREHRGSDGMPSPSKSQPFGQDSTRLFWRTRLPTFRLFEAMLEPSRPFGAALFHLSPLGVEQIKRVGDQLASLVDLYTSQFLLESDFGNWV